MKQILTTLALVLATSLVGQTSLEEFNYADNGHRLLVENGLPTREDLSFVEISRFKVFADDDLVFLKLLRDDNSVSCVFIGFETMHSYGVICDPRSSQEIKDKSKNSLRLFFSDGKFDEHEIITEFVQRVVWSDLAYWK